MSVAADPPDGILEEGAEVVGAFFIGQRALVSGVEADGEGDAARGEAVLDSALCARWWPIITMPAPAPAARTRLRVVRATAGSVRPRV
jgi:hypothetical protein